MPHPNHRLPIIDRVIDKLIVLEDGCIVFGGATNSDGYGMVRVNGRLTRAHRLVYEAIVGQIPDGLQLDHLCRNRICCNPRHLEPVTVRENNMRGLSLAALNARKTHCHRGHPFDETNTGRGSRGARVCRACARLKTAEYRARRRQTTVVKVGEPT